MLGALDEGDPAFWDPSISELGQNRAGGLAVVLVPAGVLLEVSGLRLGPWWSPGALWLQPLTLLVGLRGSGGLIYWVWSFFPFPLLFIQQTFMKPGSEPVG